VSRRTAHPLAASLYATFAAYEEVDHDFCGQCYKPSEAARLRDATPRELSTKDARKLLEETADHWSSSASYRRYLPRILEALAPPESAEPLYPDHFPATLAALGFTSWPPDEREAVLRFLKAISPLPSFSPEDQLEWQAACSLLSVG